MESVDPQDSTGEPDQVRISPQDYLKEVLDSGGNILQLDTIGALTLITTYRGLGAFECVIWSDVDYRRRNDGQVLSRQGTLEMAKGFHHALSEFLWYGPWGEATRTRAERFEEDLEAQVLPLKDAGYL